jgi:ADP-heptose:LPS heptosyltransferase
VSPSAQRLLVIRLGAMGDVLRTLPAVAALRSHYSDASLSWLVEERCAGVLEARAIVDHVLVAPRAETVRRLRAGRLAAAAGTLGELRNRLRRERFDLVVDFHAIFKSGALSLITGSKQRASFAAPVAREGSWRAANLRAELARKPCTRFARNAALVHFLAAGPVSDSYRLDVDPVAATRLRGELGPGPDPVVLHADSSESAAYKRWPVERWAALAVALARAGERVLVAGSGSASRARAVVEAAAGAAERAPATPCFEDLAALLQQAKAFVGADSGPLHAASLVGTPVVQILGPTHPVENRPFSGTPFRQVRADLACSPCRRGCAAAACMRAVDVERVQRAFEEVLDEVRVGAA